MWGNAGDGQYTGEFGDIRDRASALGTTAIVTEYGHPLTGYTSDKAPTVLKAMYQGLDSRLSGANWWADAAGSGSVLSGTQWQWDIYSGRHSELMNGNASKVETSGDAWNGEDFSSVSLDDSGVAGLRQDTRLLDRAYPSATAGHALAFTYEDRSGNGSSSTLTWNPVPSTLPSTAALVGSSSYGVLVWRSNGSTAPTELHLPAAFSTSTTTVVSDLGTVSGLPSYTSATATPIAVAAETGGAGSRRLLLSTPASDSGKLHFALVARTSATVSASVRAAAQSELASWASAAGFGS
jgi:hypothetical protein